LFWGCPINAVVLAVEQKISSYSADCKSLAKEPDVSKERTAVLMNISMTSVLAGQLERLSEIMKREAK
jgi:hypothetical protein